jgi:hypothetical protein
VPSTIQQLEFQRDDLEKVLACMAPLAALPGTGWVNFDAGVAAEIPVPPRSILGSLFTARGPVVPHCSWVPEPGLTSIGIQHASGPRALPRLVDAGFPLRPGWRRQQDHPRRGLVVAVPAGADPAALEEVLRWLLSAGAALTTVPLTGYWMATVHRRK